MKTKKWIQRYTRSLSGKRIAVTGTTGGLGKALCRNLASLGADLILLDRNAERSDAFRDELLREFDECSVECVTVDLSEFSSVRKATEELKEKEIDCFIHNAGAYSIPRKLCDTGYDNVFQINFVSPYFMIRELLPMLRERHGRVVVVGSIAHNYSNIDPEDIDFSTRKKASLVYGNAKRYLTYSILALAEQEKEVDFCVAHPGISFTNITAHYPKLIFAVIKHPMKVIFMKPKRACLSILWGVFEKCSSEEWIGPKFFDVWGLPKKKKLATAKPSERAEITRIAENTYQILSVK
ncbi:MAG: SDR family NAD(P)-dependent oxidoreductase [Clostridia bacterium]|nr:SDR family NAD(P)-dependent oxidoreductase [Clostridia bacterium]